MFIGIDIGGTNIKGILASKDGDILNHQIISTAKDIDKIEEDLQRLIFELGTGTVGISEIKAVGIGAAGSIDKKKGIIMTSPNIPAWDMYPIVKRIENRINVKVFLENDATAAIMGEWWKGQGKKFENWVLLTLGSGIGGGAVIQNRLYTGQAGSSMEFGHTTIEYKGKKCPCGSTGCLERYASANAVVSLAKKELKKNKNSSLHNRLIDEKLSAKLLSEEGANGDEFSKSIFEKVGKYLGIGIANVVNVLNPEAIILGGGLSQAHKLFLPTLKETVKERALTGMKENIKFLITEDNEKMASLGAIKIAIDMLSINNN